MYSSRFLPSFKKLSCSIETHIVGKVQNKMTMTVLYFLEYINSSCLARRTTRGPWIIAYFSLQDLLARDLDWLYASFEVDTLSCSFKTFRMLSEAFRLSRSLSISLFDYDILRS